VSRRHPEDHIRYQQLLEDTAGSNGVVSKTHARKLLAEELAERTERIAEFAESRASEVADQFDEAHRPQTDDEQMTLVADTYLVIGDAERVRADRATAAHTRQWMDIQRSSKAKHDAAHAKKMARGLRLLEIQEKQACSLWEAQQLLAGGAA
jgi:hypothetical protein